MSRFSKYYLQTILCLDDGLCSYYVQDSLSSHNDILDVPVVVFDHEQDAEQMLRACIEYNAFSAVNQLRSFLAEECQGYHFIYQMDDHEVVQAVADELTGRSYQIVVEPGQGWAVRIDEITSRLTAPVYIEPEPDMSPALKELNHYLDGLVADQRKKYNEIEDRLSKLSDAERAAIYAQKAGGGVFSSIFGGMVSTIKAVPGFVKGSVTTLYKVAQFPSQLGAVAFEAIATGSMGPLEAEIDKIVLPVANTYEEVKRYKSILCVLFQDEQTMAVLRDFGKRFYDATHPLELTEMGAENATDIVMTILMSIPTGGAAGAANLATKAPKLAKVIKKIVELLERLAKMIKRVGHRLKLPTKGGSGGGVVATAKNRSIKAKKRGMPDVEKPKVAKGADKQKIEVNDIGSEANGPKTTTHTGVGATGQGIPKERVKPDVLKEVHPDDKAAYGYSPNKGTAYEKFDFTDVDAAKKNRKIRTEYLDGSKRLENDIKTMRAEGASSEQIGHHVVNERNLQKVEARQYMSPEEIKVLEERNLTKYKNPVGPTPEQAFKSQKKKLIRNGEYSSDKQVWDRVIEKSMKKDDVINTLLGIEHH